MDLAQSVADAILAAESDAIVAADKDGIIVFWNRGATRIFGYECADAIGQSLDIIIPQRLRQRHWDGYRHVLAGGQSRYGAGDLLAVPAIRHDGSTLSIEFTIAPLRNGAGEPVGFVAVIRDVSKRFEEMRALRQRLAAITPRGAGA
jgi:PAS domain S-box-containing protein